MMEPGGDGRLHVARNFGNSFGCGCEIILFSHLMHLAGTGLSRSRVSDTVVEHFPVILSCLPAWDHPNFMRRETNYFVLYDTTLHHTILLTTSLSSVVRKNQTNCASALCLNMVMPWWGSYEENNCCC